jgi:hypothetical protein
MPVLFRPGIPSLHAPQRRLHRDLSHALSRPLPPLRPAPAGKLHRRQPLSLFQHQAATKAPPHRPFHSLDRLHQTPRCPQSAVTRSIGRGIALPSLVSEKGLSPLTINRIRHSERSEEPLYFVFVVAVCSAFFFYTNSTSACTSPAYSAIHPAWIAHNDRLATTIQSATPWTSGRIPTSFNVFLVMPVPIKNSTTVSAARPNR